MNARVFAGEILQVISNLILNALDAVPETGGVLSLRVRRYKGKVHLSVTDNGRGVAPAMLGLLFQAHRTTKSDGNGLGLWLSKSIAEKHNGTNRLPTPKPVQVRPRTTFRLISASVSASHLGLSNGRSIDVFERY